MRNELTKSETDAISVLFLAFGLFAMLFFSLSKSKLPGYILPTVPMFGFVTAKWLALDIRNGKYWKTLGLVVISLTGIAVLGVVSIQALVWERLPQPKPYALAGIAIAALGLTSVLTCARLAMRSGIICSGVLVVVLFVSCANASFLLWIDSVVSPRPIANILKSNQKLANTVFSYRLNRARLFGTNFYLRRQLQEWDGNPARPVVALVSPDGLNALRQRQIQYTILDRTCLEAMLVEIGKQEKSVKPSGT